MHKNQKMHPVQTPIISDYPFNFCCVRTWSQGNRKHWTGFPQHLENLEKMTLAFLVMKISNFKTLINMENETNPEKIRVCYY